MAAARSPTKRLFSHDSLRGSRRRQRGLDSESSDLQKQLSLDGQVSVLSEGKPKLERLSSKKQQEEWDKELPQVCQ